MNTTIIKLARALTRQQWKDGAEHFISSALSKHALAEVAELNGDTGHHLEHWRKDVERLIDIELPMFLDIGTTKSQFDKRRAIEEIIRDSERKFPRWLEVARKTLAANYDKHTKNPTDFKIPDPALSGAAFWLRVREAVNGALE
jgi:hypothetical protein